MDGRVVEDLPGVRRVMPFLMRGRNESAVFFEQTLDLERALPWLERFNEGRARRAHLFHLVLGGLARTLHEHPKLNRYVVGRRVYQRDEVSISFAMKPERSERSALSVVKLVFSAEEPFAALVDRVVSRIEEGRRGKKSGSDREADVLSRLPSPLLELGVRAFRALDAIGLAPRAMLESDPMHASVFVANLGSLGMDTAFHHLYEYGDCPVFAVLGKIERAPVVVGDRVEARTVARMRYTYDERIEDGFYAGRALARMKELVEDPAAWAR